MSQTRVLITPRPRATVLQQPTLLPNLQTTTLAPVVAAAPVMPQPFVMPARRRVVQDIQQLDLLNTTLSLQLYFLNDTALSVTGRYVQRPQEWPNLLLTTLVVNTKPFKQDDWQNPVRAIYKPQPIQQNGVLQGLTFVAPSLPFNKYDWPNPQPVKPVPERWNSSQGQNPDNMPPTVVVPDAVPQVVDVTGGGYRLFFHYEQEQIRKRKRRREREEAEEAAQAIPDPVTQEIAQLLQRQDREDDRRADLERLRALVQEIPVVDHPRVNDALKRVRERQTLSALANLDRELRKAMDEEDFAIMMMLIND